MFPSLSSVSCVEHITRVRAVVSLVIAILRIGAWIKWVSTTMFEGIRSFSGVCFIIRSMIFIVKFLLRQWALWFGALRILILTMVLNLARWKLIKCVLAFLLSAIVDDVFWIHRKAKEILFDWHLEIFDFHNTNDFIWNLEVIDVLNLVIVDPSGDKLEGPVEVINYMLISICFLEIFNDWWLNISWSHLNSIPFEFHIHVIKPHVKINVNILVCNGHDFLRIKLVINNHFHVKNDAHLLLGEDKSWSSQVHEPGT